MQCCNHNNHEEGKTRKEGDIIKYKSLLALTIIEKGTGENKF